MCWRNVITEGVLTTNVQKCRDASYQPASISDPTRIVDVFSLYGLLITSLCNESHVRSRAYIGFSCKLVLLQLDTSTILHSNSHLPQPISIAERVWSFQVG